MAFVTRFKRRLPGGTGTATIDGPVSGSIIVIPVQFPAAAVAGSAVHTGTIDLPPGMSLKIVAITVKVVTLASDPSLTVGTTVGGAEIVSAVNVTDGLVATLIATDVTDLLSVRITNDADDGYANATVNIFAYVSAPPTSLVERNIGHA